MGQRVRRGEDCEAVNRAYEAENSRMLEMRRNDGRRL
jgi:hypothetical protein